MVVNMSSNKFIIFITFIAVILMIALPTYHKVVLENQRKLTIVNEKMIIEAAQKCFYDGKCPKTKVTLRELYDNNYLNDKVSDPVTKAFYSDEAYVLLKKEESVFSPS